MTPARELLEFSRSTVDEIAATVGHDDVRGFRRFPQNRGIDAFRLPPSLFPDQPKSDRDH
jgi:transcriptional regulator GlxA family with amidase domain